MEKQVMGSRPQAAKPRTYTDEYRRQVVDMVTSTARTATSVAAEVGILFPRAVRPTLYDAITAACQRAGFQPLPGVVAPQISSIINLVAAGFGVSIVPDSMSQLLVRGVVFRPASAPIPPSQIALAHRKADTSAFVRNFVSAAAS